MLVTRRMIEQQPDMVQRLVTAHARATETLQQDRERWLGRAEAFGTPRRVLELCDRRSFATPEAAGKAVSKGLQGRLSGPGSRAPHWSPAAFGAAAWSERHSQPTDCCAHARCP